MAKPYVGDVPFDANGNLDRDGYLRSTRRPNYTFKSPMRVTNWYPTKASATVAMEDPNGKTYWMFMSEFFELVRKVDLHNGETPVLTWTFHKRGTKYGMRAVLP